MVMLHLEYEKLALSVVGQMSVKPFAETLTSISSDPDPKFSSGPGPPKVTPIVTFLSLFPTSGSMEETSMKLY